MSLLELALSNRRDEAIFVLFDSGARASLVPPESLNLVWVVGTGRVDVLQAFLDAGADLGIQTGMGTPLSYATREGQLAMVVMLIEANADINMGSTQSPLLEALNKGHEEIALRLMDSGAAPDPNYYLDYAVIRSMPEVVERLAAAGCPLETRNTYSKGERPRFLAHLTASCRKISIEEAYARVMNTRDLVREPMDNVTPLLVAVYQDEPECADILLRYGAKADVLDGGGMTPFDLATRMQRKSILSLLKDSVAPARAKEIPERKEASAPREPQSVGQPIERHLPSRLVTDMDVAPSLEDSASVDAIRKHYDYESVIERLCDSCSDSTFQDAVEVVAKVSEQTWGPNR